MLAVVALAAAAFRWPGTSRIPVAPLAQPSLDSKLASLRPDATAGYSFTAFGDQRALADGEWQAMIAAIDSLTRRDSRLLFMLDTGDIVEDGSHGDQFQELASILREARSLAYLVAVGNHELADGRPGPARANTAAFLAPIDSSLRADRLYYERVIGRVRFLFLDSNDLVDDGAPGAAPRREAQLVWLAEALRRVPDRPGFPTIVVMHHPLLQSSTRHGDQARSLWSLSVGERSLPDALADAGVDLILTGHTHTYERIRATRADGRGFRIVNLSGRPRPAFLWFGAGARRARHIPTGEETRWFADRGWRGLEGWKFEQEAAMLNDEADQFAIFTVEPGGGITMALRLMNRGRADLPVRLVEGAGEAPTSAAGR
jgi:3',5'-cyclic AMP phosphodiesterase CpdA